MGSTPPSDAAELERLRQRVAELEAAQADHADLAAVLERITDAFVSLNGAWQYTYVSRKAAEIFGRRPEELIGKHIWSEFPEGVGQKFHAAYYKSLAEQ